MTSSTSTVRANLRFFGLYLILAGAGLAIFSRLLASDANFVLYRFATHLASGRGLNYLTPDQTVTTYPLVPLILSLFVNINLKVGAWLLCVASIAIGALFMDRLTGRHWMAGIAYILASLIYPSPVILVMLALALAGLDFARRQHWLLSGILIGLAILAEPSALIPAALLVLLTLRNVQSTWRYLLPAVIIPAVALALTRLSLGASDVAFIAVVPQIITTILPVLAIFALLRNRSALREKPILGLLVAWSAIAACLSLLRGMWPTVMIVPGAIALVSTLPVRFAVVLAAAIDLAFNLFLPNPSAITPSGQILGQWIATHSAAQAIVATPDIGALGYYADRSLIDLSGRLQSNPFDKDFFLRSAPDLIVLNDNTQVAWVNFKTTYAKAYSADGQTIYQRVVNFTPLQTHPVDIDFSAMTYRDDLRLTAIAIADSAHPGDLLRVRLDWQLNNVSSFDKYIKVSLNDAQGKSIITALDTIPVMAWTIGANSTYHLLVLPGNLPTGQYSVTIEVTVNNGNLGPHKVAELTVAK